MRSRPELRQGRIVGAWIEDKNGYSKLRPAVVLTDEASLQRDAQFVVAAVTTTFAQPPPPNVIPLPWHPRGHPVSRPTRRSAVVTDWVGVLRDEDIISFDGEVPARILTRIVPPEFRTQQ